MVVSINCLYAHCRGDFVLLGDKSGALSGGHFIWVVAGPDHCQAHPCKYI